MLNLMKADMYRIVRGKGLYISLALILGFVMLTLFVFRSASMGVGVQEYTPAEAYITGAVASFLALGNVAGMVHIFFIPMFIVVAIAAFSSGAVKNELTVGISRGKFYLTKFALSALLSLFLLLFNLGFSILLALPIDGVGNWGDGHITNLLQSFALQTLVMLALVSVGIFFSFVTRKTAATIGIFLAFVFVPSLVLAIMAEGFEWAMDLLRFDLASQLQFFANVSLVDDAQIVRGVVLAVGYVVVPTVAGLAIFKRAEIK